MQALLNDEDRKRSQERFADSVGGGGHLRIKRQNSTLLRLYGSDYQEDDYHLNDEEWLDGQNELQFNNPNGSLLSGSTRANKLSPPKVTKTSLKR